MAHQQTGRGASRITGDALQRAWEDGYQTSREIELARHLRFRQNLIIFAVVCLTLWAAAAWGQTCPNTINAVCTSPNLDGGGCCPSGDLRCLSSRCRPALHSGESSPCNIGAYGSCLAGTFTVCAGDHICRKISVEQCRMRGQSCRTYADCCTNQNLTCTRGTCRTIPFQ